MTTEPYLSSYPGGAPTMCPTCGLEVRLAEPYPPNHTQYWQHRQDPPDGHVAPLAVPPRPRADKVPWRGPPDSVVIDKHDATEAEMPTGALRVWKRLPPLRQATYALADMPNGRRVESIALRARAGTRRIVVQWERRLDLPGAPWKATLCRAADTAARGSYQALPVAKISQWLEPGGTS